MKHKEHWFSSKWRPALAWLYGFICLFDFVIGPLVYFWVQQFETQAVNDAYREWKPLTLQGGGLFHISMGAILGVTAYGRTQEKMGLPMQNQPLSVTKFTESETIIRPSMGDGARARPPQD